MLALQEWHRANKALDTESICPQCEAEFAADGIQPITTTVVQQPCGNPKQVVCSFCARCHDEVALKPFPPCPLSLLVLQPLCAIPTDNLPRISRLIDYDTLEACVLHLETRKSTGS